MKALATIRCLVICGVSVISPYGTQCIDHIRDILVYLEI